MFEGRPCSVIFNDPDLYKDPRLLSIPGMKTLVKILEETDGKPFPTNLDCKHLGDHLYRIKIKGKSARIIFYAISEASIIVTVSAFKKEGKKSYSEVNSSTGRARLIRRALDAYKKRKLQTEDEKPDNVKDTPVKQNKYDVASVTPIDNYCLVVSFAEDENHRKPDDVIYDLNPLIGSNAYLKNKDVFKTAKLDGDYVKWDSGTRISLHDIFAKCETVAEEDLLTERWRRRRGRHLLYR